MNNQNTNIVDEFDSDYLDSLKDLVIRDIKNESTPEEKTHLINNIDMWLYNLRVIRRDVELKDGRSRDLLKLKPLITKLLI